MKRLLLDIYFWKFIVVGVLNTIVGYGMFALFVYVGFHYAIASLLSTVLGVLFNFHSIGKLVFGRHDNRLIFRFVGVYIVIYLLNILLLYLLQQIGIDVYMAGFVALIPMAIISFVLNKYYVFGVKNENN